MGRLLAIATHAKSRAPIEVRESAAISTEAGVEGDFRGATRDQNVTVVAREGWEAACKELGEDVAWTLRRANLLVEGVNLHETTGRRLRIGEVVLEITGECAPCRVMDAQRAGLRAALTPGWRAGVSCRVVAAGAVRVGDAVELIG